MIPAQATEAPDTRVRRARLNAAGMFAFLCGAGAMVKINLVGEVYLAELLLLASLPATLASPGARAALRSPLFRALAMLCVVSLVGYVVSDMVRGSRSEQFMRGWARMVFMGLDFVALASLFARDPRLIWWFCAGIGVGGMLYLRLAFGMPLSNWKFGYSEPVTFLVLSMGNFVPLRGVSLMLAALGVWSALSDYRIHGATCLLLAVLVWARTGRGADRPPRASTYILVAVLGAVAMGVLQVALSARQDSFAGRRSQSDFGREVGLRVGIKAISESPLIGYGSWPETKELIELSDEAVQEVLDRAAVKQYYGPRGVFFPAHSQILQAWLEGGLLGVAFFAFYGWRLARNARVVAMQRPADILTPAMLYLSLFQLWHLVQSPIGQNQRLYIAVACAVMVVVAAAPRPPPKRSRGR